MQIHGVENHREATKPVEKLPGTASTERGPGRRIVLAEDHPDSLHVVALVLRMRGHEVETAMNGSDALEKVRATRPDAVLLDIGMPVMDGYEAARRIRSEPWGKDMFLVAMTGWGQERDKRRAFEAGFDAHLTKPVDFKALQKLLQSHGEAGGGPEREAGGSPEREAGGSTEREAGGSTEREAGGSPEREAGGSTEREAGGARDQDADRVDLSNG